MFCPHCGHEHTSEKIRFCPQCRFPIGGVKDLLEVAYDSAKKDLEEGKKPYPLRQTDITIGGGLMLIGVLKTILAISLFFRVPNGPAMAILMFAVIYGLIQLVSQFSPRQRGLSLGATLIFFGTLACVAAAAAVGEIGPLLVGPVIIFQLLFWQRLTGAVRSFFLDPDADERKSPITLLPKRPSVQTSHTVRNPALSPIQHTMIIDTITDSTTELLENVKPMK